MREAPLDGGLFCRGEKPLFLSNDCLTLENQVGDQLLRHSLLDDIEIGLRLASLGRSEGLVWLGTVTWNGQAIRIWSNTMEPSRRVPRGKLRGRASSSELLESCQFGRESEGPAPC